MVTLLYPASTKAAMSSSILSTARLALTTLIAPTVKAPIPTSAIAALVAPLAVNCFLLVFCFFDSFCIRLAAFRLFIEAGVCLSYLTPHFCPFIP